MSPRGIPAQRGPTPRFQREIGAIIERLKARRDEIDAFIADLTRQGQQQKKTLAGKRRRRRQVSSETKPPRRSLLRSAPPA